MKRLLLPVVIASAGFIASAQNHQTYPIGEITTRLGKILIWLYDETPNHKASFMKLANDHYWDSLTFNRVIDNFVAQGGCPDTPEGFGESPYLLKPEINSHVRHIYGAVGAGQDGNKEKISAGCQFYIVQNRAGLPRLDGTFTVFGFVFKGMDVVDRIVQVKTDSTGKPYEPIPLTVRIMHQSASELKTEGFDVPKR